MTQPKKILYALLLAFMSPLFIVTFEIFGQRYTFERIAEMAGRFFL
jgi:hypothetical protein